MCVSKGKKVRLRQALEQRMPKHRKKSTSKRRYVETAGSEQTSSVFMLWAKTRVYICSGRAGGNERDLLFYVRYEETCHHPTPSHVMRAQSVESHTIVPTPPHPM